HALAKIDKNFVQVVTLDQKNLGDFEFDGVHVRRLLRSNWPMVLDLNIGPTRRRLIAELRRLEPTVVHFHEAWGMGVVPTPCAQIFTVHGFDSENLIADQDRFSRVRSVMWKLTQMRGYGRAKHMVSISPYVTGYIRQYSKGVIHEIDNPVDE